MDMVRVDPKMFVTCRLCLEETGIYQITPVVQEQIKFCFDIDVNPFDGLPQLICGNCETILSEYFTKKRIFVGRQNALKAKLEVRKEMEEELRKSPQQDAVSLTAQNDSENVTQKPKKGKKRKLRIISSSSDDTDQLNRDMSASPGRTSVNTAKRRRIIHHEDWEVHFDKKYACKMCYRSFRKRGSITRHVSKKHTNLLSDYQNILSRTCTVKIIKLDDHPNITGSSKTVALRTDKIIGQQQTNSLVVYMLKGESKRIERDQSRKSIEGCEISDDSDTISVKRRKCKRIKLLSRSSTDTVVLKDDEEGATSSDGERETKCPKQSVEQNDTEIECINIDDSSNSTDHSDVVPYKDTTHVPIKPKDVEGIKNIIKVCHSKHIKKRNECPETQSQMSSMKKIKTPQLKHKLLSMGRKIIKNEGLNCTGLLRFMEHKNLPVKWVPTHCTTNKESNYVRIMTRLKGERELAPDNLGWKNKMQEVERNENGFLQKQNISGPFNTGEKNKTEETETTDKVKPQNGETCIPSTENGENVTEELKVTESVSSHKVKKSLSLSNFKNKAIELEATALSKCENPISSIEITSVSSLASYAKDKSLAEITINDDKKLLNANPVANPKQLPKKSADSKFFVQAAISRITSQSFAHPNVKEGENIFIHLVEDPQQENGNCMPIISSTTSLAAVASGDSKDNAVNINTISSTDNTDEIEKPAPRIKVKPVSEINSGVHSNAVLKNHNHQLVESGSLWTLAPQQENIGSAPQAPSDPHTDSVHADPAKNLKEVEIPMLQENNRNFVILDTVEFPNTKTDSPFRYLKNLLQLHNIILLDSNEQLPADSSCLLNFKVQFNKSVTLSLSVHCARNVFSLRVLCKQTNLILNQLTAHWQWEILKTYTTKEDVIRRLLQSAQKLSQEVFSYTNSFLCLLKSIVLKI